MDIIRATMPRVAQRGVDASKGKGSINVNLAALSQFAKRVKARNMAHVWKGRRTGLMIDDAQVTKDVDGLDNIESFWESACLDGDGDGDGASTPGTASVELSTPGSDCSPLVSPESAASSRWTRPGVLEAAAGSGGRFTDGKKGSDDDGAGESDEDGGGDGVAKLAKKLEFPPAKTMPSPALSRSEISTDEEVAGAKCNDEDDVEEGNDRDGETGQAKASARHSSAAGVGVALAHGSGDALDAADAAAGQVGDFPAIAASATLSTANPVADNPRAAVLAGKAPALEKETRKVPASAAKKNGGDGGKGSGRVTLVEGGLGGGGGGGGGGRGRRGGGEGSTPVTSTRTTRASSGGVGSAGASGLATRAGGRHSIGSLVSQDALTDKDFGNGGDADDLSSDDDAGGGGGGWDDVGCGEGDSDSSDTDIEETKAHSPGSQKVLGVKSPKTRPEARATAATRASAGKTPTNTPASPSAASNRRTRGSASVEGKKGDDKAGDVAGSSPAAAPATATAASAGESKGKKGPTTRGPISPSSPASPSAPAPPASDLRSKGEGKRRRREIVTDREEKDDDLGSDSFGAGAGVDDFDDGGGGPTVGEGQPPTPSPPGVGDAAPTVSSPGTRRKGKGRQENGSKTKPAAAAADVKKNSKRKGDMPMSKRKSKGVVARLSIGGSRAAATSGGEEGKGKRARTKAAAPVTPGPPRQNNASLFVEMSEVAEVSNTPGVRRSGRQRVAPLKWWKGDNIQYQVDEEGLPVARGIVKGPSTTPAPSRKRARGEGEGGGKKRDRILLDPLSPSRLGALPGRAKYMQKEEECVVWDEDSATNIRRHVVMRASNLVNHTLKATLDRPPGKDKVGAAAQAFNVPAEVGISEWLSGRLQLPPQAIKDSEHVAHSTQIYIIGEGQRNAVELAIALPTNEVNSNVFDPATAQRFLLSPGDHFYVPVNNVYRLENHSKQATAVIYWAILKPALG